MKKAGKRIGLMSLILIGTLMANAQTGNPNWIVSKDVQRVANKKMFEASNIKNSHIQVKSVAFPSIVVSKGIVRKGSETTSGNVNSKGYPSWIISKGVHQIRKK